MKHYKQLTSEQRYQISGLLKAGYKRVEIAIEVGVNKSTISRELKRNRGQRGWRPKQAQAMRDERRRSCVNARQFTPGDWECVEELIRWGFSPEQAAKRLALEGNSRISHETICQRVYTDKRQGASYGGNCAVRSHTASVTVAARSGAESSRIGSVLNSAQRLWKSVAAWVIGKEIRSSARTIAGH